MTAYYNEIEPYAAEWLRNLIAAGCIASGVVDPRSIRDVRGPDLGAADRCHFFAGIAGWDLALRLAGWPDDVPVWTGSCPCQPFSQAGRRRGTADDRHLWPEWFRLIRECRPPVVFGEQVASPAGLAWLDAVSADLEGEGYAVGAADLCAAGVGAPHLRQRLFFVAVGDGERLDGIRLRLLARGSREAVPETHRRGTTGVVADSSDRRRQEGDGFERGATGARNGPADDRVMGDPGSSWGSRSHGCGAPRRATRRLAGNALVQPRRGHPRLRQCHRPGCRGDLHPRRDGHVGRDTMKHGGKS